MNISMLQNNENNENIVKLLYKKLRINKSIIYIYKSSNI